MFTKFLVGAFGVGALLASTNPGSDDGNSPNGRFRVVDSDKMPRRIAAPADKVRQTPAAEMPKVWIGVRCVPVNEALASHLGRTGLMVANVMVGSPADQAGVEKHDVLISLDGKPVDNMNQLVESVVSAGAGKSSSLVVLRGGREKSLTITPSSRPSDGEMRFKYDEPPAVEASPDVQYFGHRLDRDPMGNWMLQPLGRLGDLPDDVREKLGDVGNPSWQRWQDMMKSLQREPFRFGIQMDPSDPNGGMFFFPSDESDDAQVDINISVNENGNQTSVSRGADGRVQVKRTDADGNTTSESYENMDEFREKSPEAYKTYRRFSGYRSRPTIMMRPDMQNLGQMQKDFQEKIESALEDAKEQTRKTLEEVDRAKRSIRMKINSGSADGRKDGINGSFESVNIRVEDDGRIMLELRENESTRKYEFKSREDFQQSEPELFKRFEKLIGESGRRTQAAVLEVALG